MQNKDLILSESFVGKMTQRLSVPAVSEGILLMSVALFWYEAFLSRVGLGFMTGAAIPSVLLILALLFADKSRIKLSRPILYLIAFFVLALFSGVLAAGRGISPVFILSGWVLFAQFLIAILAAQGVAKPKRLAENAMYLSIPMIAMGGYQFFSGQATSKLWLSAAENGITTRAFAFFGSPNVLGAVLAIVSLSSLGLFLSEKNKYIGLVSALAAAVTVLTFSRSAWIGLAAGFFIILIIRNWKLVLLSPLALLVLLFGQLRTRLLTTLTPAYWFDSSLDGRLWSVNNGFHILAKYPLFGSGPGAYGGQLALNYSCPVCLQGIQNGYVALYFTDNQWLQILVQTGVTGILLFSLFVAEMLYRLIVQYNEQHNALTLGIIGALVAFIITGFFGNLLEFGAVAVPMGIILGVSFNETRLA